MANKLIKALNHNFDSNSIYDRLPFDGNSGVAPTPPEPDDPVYSLIPKAKPTPGIDKSKSISQLTNEELEYLLERLRKEGMVEEAIRTLKRYSGEKDSYEQPMITNTTTPINQLYHYGIPGMRWGVRRFQNKDGTRTPAGRRREREDASGTSSQNNSSTAKKPKKIDKLSNDELRTLNERLQLEETYKRLTSAQMQKGQSWVAKTLGNAGQQAAQEFSKNIMLGGAKLLVKELSPELASAAFGIKTQKGD